MKSRIPDPNRYRPAPTRRDRAKTRRPPFVRALQLLAISTTGGAIIVVGLGGLAFWRSGSRFMEGVKMALTPQPPEETVDVRTVVVEQVRDVSELTTAVFTMEAVVPTQSNRKIGEYTIGKTNLLYIAYGETRAGIDLSKLETTDVSPSDEGKRVKLTLPPPKVFGTEIDVERSNVYDYSRGFLNLGPDRALELQAAAEEKAVLEIAQAACEQNILGQANDRAELVVSQLLQTTGFEEVIVETTASTAADCMAQL